MKVGLAYLRGVVNYFGRSQITKNSGVKKKTCPTSFRTTQWLVLPLERRDLRRLNHFNEMEKTEVLLRGCYQESNLIDATQLKLL